MEGVVVTLPTPVFDSATSVEEALSQRRSVRDYSGEALTVAEVAQLLWSAQGITSPEGLRAAPSAGALYPLEVYVVVGDVEELERAVYRYRPDSHDMVMVLEGDRRGTLCEAALGQEWVREAAVNIVFTGIMERTTGKYAERGVRYVYMEAGHAAQNLCLQGVALDLGMVTVGAFEESKVRRALGLPDEEVPVYIIPTGRKS
jgi:SagB-type dehydrogenase family enzyme